MSMFSDLAKNRKNRYVSSCSWGVFKVRKDGTLGVTTFAVERTQEDALRRRDYLESLNPGSVFIVRSL